MKIKVKFNSSSKLINKFYFLLNLSGGFDFEHNLMGEGFNIKRKLTRIEKEELDSFKKIIRNYSFWCIERVFCEAGTELIAWKKLSLIVMKQEMVVFQKVFKLFTVEFNNIYKRVDKKYLNEFIILWNSNKYDNIKNKLFNFFITKNEKFELNVKFVFSNKFNGFFRGRAYGNLILIEIPNLGGRYDLLENIIFLLMHEVTHVLIKKNQIIEFEIGKLIHLYNLERKVKKYKIDSQNFIEEVLIRMFIPKGYFSQRDTSLLKEVKSMKVIDKKRINLHLFSMLLLKMMWKDIENYVKRNKKIDSDFIGKVILKIVKKI